MQMKYWALLTFFISIHVSRAQCIDDFNLGNDTSICANETLILNASNIYDNYTWQNNNTTNFLIVTGPGTYSCVTNLASNINLVSNGSFELGNTSFTTDYTYYPIADIFGPQASYGIINNPNTWFNPFNPCNDHTSGNGQMMVIDGSAFNGGNDAIWCQNINVQSGANYNFTYWIQSVTNSNILANIQVRIDGIIVDTQLAPLGACNWQEREIYWTSPTTGSVSFCLYDLELAGNGNDFALDDISLVEVCEYTDTIVVGLSPIDTLRDSAKICFGDSLFLGGSWETQAGVYYDLTLGSACNDIMETELSFNTTDTLYNQVEICPGDSSFLEGAWQTQAGFYYDFVISIVCDDVVETQLLFSTIDTLFTQVEICPSDSLFLEGSWQTQIGLYYDFVGGVDCNDVLETELLFSNIDTLLVQAEICPGDSVFLEGEWQSQPDFYYDFVAGFPCNDVLETELVFTQLDTTIVVEEICDGDSFFIEGNWQYEEGVFYELVSGIGCDDVLETSLVLNELPIADAGNDMTVSYEQIVSLSASGSVSTVQYLWSTIDSFTSENQSIDVEVDTTVQLYYLQTTDNGCSNFDTVTIFGIPLNLAIRVPNAFTPNADGVNDGFRLVNNDEFEELTMKIYNRWGELIYLEKGEKANWKGDYSNGKICPIGVYTFYIEAKPYGGLKSMAISGTVSLIR